MSILPWILLAAGCWRRDPGPLPAGDPTRPDIILVSIDTLRADHLSSYGYGRETSPFLDQLAAQGTRFPQARSASPWTLPAHTTMLTGQLPATHRVVDDSLALSPSVPVLPALLQGVGYRTGGFVSTLYVSRKFGFERGFDQFSDFGIDSEKENLSGGVNAQDVIDAALSWWSEQPAGEPTFLFLHFYDVHYAYDAPPPYDTLFDRAPAPDDPVYKHYFHFKKHPLTDAQLDHQIAQYDEEIRYVDDQLRRLYDAAQAAGRQVRWVVTADHGEEFGERGSWGHAHTLYAEQLHIPLIISGAGLPAGQAPQGWVGSHDIAPTIAAWTGIGADLRADGLDLGPILSGAPVPDRPFLGETTRFKSNRLSLLEGGLRLEWDLKENTAELFAPAADPAETTDLARAQPADVARLRARLVELLGVDWEVQEAGRVTLDEGTYLLAPDGRRTQARVTAGDCFLALPYDGAVSFAPLAAAAQGPWQAAGGAVPDDAAGLRLLRSASADAQTLDAQTREQLVLLGYMQEGDEGEAPTPRAPPEPLEVGEGGLPRCR